MHLLSFRIALIVLLTALHCETERTTPPVPRQVHEPGTPEASSPAASAPRRFQYDPTRRTGHVFSGMGVNLHPLEPEHLPALEQLHAGYIRVGAGPGWGGMTDPAFPDEPAAMSDFIAAHFNRDDPRRLADFRASFEYFRERNIRVILVLYQIPYHWLKKDFMRTLKYENVDRLAAHWLALLRFFREQNMRVDLVELANEPDGNWDGHIPKELYYRLVLRTRRAFDQNGFTHVRLLGPGLSSLDLEHRSESWINAMPPAVATALGGFSLHGWDEIHATASMPDYLARSWEHPRAAFRRLDPHKPIYLTEYATEITSFGGRVFASPRSGALYTAAESPRYGLRILANTLVHLNSGVAVPILWRLSDNDSDWTAWGMIRGKRRGGTRRPYFQAMSFLGPRLPRDSRVVPVEPGDAPAGRDTLSASLLAGKDSLTWAAANLDFRPRKVILRIKGSGLRSAAGSIYRLDGTVVSGPRFTADAKGEIALTIAAESALILQFQERSK